MIIIAVIVGNYFYLEQRKGDGNKTNESAVVEEPKEASPIETTPPTETIPPTPDPQDELEIALKEQIKQYDGNWSIYIEDLKRNKKTIINEKQMVAASLIKLFTAGEYFDAISNKGIAETPYSDSLLRLMISQSDNDAWEALETYFGGYYENGLQEVTEFAQKNGYPKTGRLIGAPSIYSEDAKNLSSVSDIGKALNNIYYGTYVNKDASEKILNCMLNQERRDKIPAGLPEDIQCANKTGELYDVQNDAAIIYTDTTDYILVVMTENQIDDLKSFDDIANVSKLVYEYMIQINEE